ncbi:MAG: AmmeMemoRadiSam system protein B [endosymbiont of Galathealinum brachiosum]|uniref:MEMO1 family protein DIZ80_09815 n=1 Tax=endosymbiont of Galathealinum brachiosum TaxID=2200906 RepID=A0A370DCD3_9GAMM|nr:MAG: AmmeMemoRadiSam system protein B [endosymbiont of Galathealinum brachiosum]
MTNTSSRTRPAAVAGMFYAGDPQQLSSDIQQFLDQADNPTNIIPKAIIAPHAGYQYSGSVAASAYKLLTSISNKIKQVILLGPAHRVAFSGIATPDADYFETPLGLIKVNSTFCKKAEQLDFVQHNKLAHKEEHSLEVHLPFLQTVLNDFELTPLVVGDCNRNDVAKLLELFWGDNETLFIISTDLSHFNAYDIAKEQDLLTSNNIEKLQAENIHYDDACGRNPLNGLLTLAKQHHLKVNCLDLRNSGDTSGNKDRVVGYGSYVVY